MCCTYDECGNRLIIRLLFDKADTSRVGKSVVRKRQHSPGSAKTQSQGDGCAKGGRSQHFPSCHILTESLMKIASGTNRRSLIS